MLALCLDFQTRAVALRKVTEETLPGPFSSALWELFENGFSQHILLNIFSKGVLRIDCFFRTRHQKQVRRTQ